MEEDEYYENVDEEYKNSRKKRRKKLEVRK
jgi:hypothetical protein